MKTTGGRRKREAGFALVITLTLLALLVLAVFALSALTKVNTQIAAAALQQTQARQNALLGLGAALNELQINAGPDDRITAMAGVTGLGANGANTTRHWCGVWDGSGNFVTWLASGANPGSVATVQNGLAKIKLVDAGSVGASTANSEHVEVGKLALSVVDPLTNQVRIEGNYAYWVGDEGVKVSAYAPEAGPGVSPILGSYPANILLLRTALENHAAKLPRIIAYEQLRLLPTPPNSAALADGVLRDCFHHTTLTAYHLVPQGVGASRQSGVINLNTNSALVWRGICETYNLTLAVPQISTAALSTSPTTSLPSRIANGITAKNGPFASVTAFADGMLLSDALTDSGSGVLPEEFIAVVRPMLAVRSDTFRIRGYGDVLNRADQATVQATACCEAIVQRVPNGLGRRFVIVYFRWLGPDAI